MVRKILVCLDGSALGEQILPVAAEQARCFQAELILLQAVPLLTNLMPSPGLEAGLMFPPTPTEVELSMAQVKENESQALVYLEGKAAPLRLEGLRVSCVAKEGQPGPVILEFARQQGVDLIALVTHGRSGLGRAIFGSVAEQVLKNSGLPLLIMHPRRSDGRA
jgi:nucleotide-binding universal stress UspA family protein